VFLGTYSPRLDDKGRLFLPAKFRDQLAEGLVITKGQEHCLYVFSTEEFARRAAALQSAPLTAKTVRDYGRVFFAAATDQVPDRQGRVSVPATLRTYARLTRDCTVIGANDRIEIWDTASWESYLGEHEEAFAAQAEEVVPGVL
jgi:MraZ protein